MPTPTTPREDVPTSAIPVPNPTHPVAGRPVASGAPTFDWTPVPDAKAYRLQLAASDAFETLYYDDTVDGPTTLDLDDILPADAGGGVWRVRAETPEETPWSTTAHFEGPRGPAGDDREFLVDAAPMPIHPIRGDDVEASAAAFTWEAVPEASGYHVQVAANEAFDDRIVDLTVDRVTSLTLFEMLPAEQGSLCWRVRALFPNESEGPWSDTARFGTHPDVDPDDEALAASEEAPTDTSEPPSDANSPMASGPAREAHTSPAMALTFIAVLLVSFLVTILLIMIYL
jgi:hypothetical protein